MKGLCQSKCPPGERNHRQRHNLIHPMECASTSMLPSDQGKTRTKCHDRVADPQRMVKEYSRPAADKKIRPEDVRPFPILRETVDYLIGLVQTQATELKSPGDWFLLYNFVMDRLRAIRQDIIVQELPAQETSQILEQILPFYISSRVRSELMLHNSSPSLGHYDHRLHLNELNECFDRWETIVHSCGIGSDQMKFLYLLYNCQQVNVLNKFIEWYGLHISADSTEAKIWDFLLAYRLDNFIRLFRIFADFNSLLKEAVWPFLGGVRRRALETLTIAYNSMNVNIPTDVLVEWLGLPCTESLDWCLTQMFENMTLNGHVGPVKLASVKFKQNDDGQSDPRSAPKSNSKWCVVKNISI